MEEDLALIVSVLGGEALCSGYAPFEINWGI